MADSGGRSPVSAPPRRLVVAVATYRRPQLLAGLLPLLDEQARAVSSEGLSTEILVVDNDPEGSAGPEVTALTLETPLTLVSEPRPGLTAARNRILDEAGNAGLLAFIDDDEQPSSGWLTRLLEVMTATEATAVTGPVESSPVEPLDMWLKGTEVFARARHSTGTTRRALATNNLLLDLHQVRDMSLRFDPRFGLTGGEDSMFGQSLLRRGGTIVWCDEAVVRERVPEDRLTRAWALNRATRSGETWVRVRTVDPPRLRAAGLRLRYAATGAVRWTLGTALALISRARGDAEGLGRHQFSAAGALGMIRGALGRTIVEYSRG
ncbi:hypothetical protein A8L58_15160 [Acidipropionibacterium acidipropionici]|uniref:Glycosyltransferase 2-like domain-containing protein n=1 Tax=Acidipropionibacterium acidipropionici TaxID=1748 RepID=A0ABN4U9H6_9ACTN|nr:hypothetical protein A8L58_15160 [Acidipropionibacterium acidipropionici]